MREVGKDVNGLHVTMTFDNGPLPVEIKINKGAGILNADLRSVAWAELSRELLTKAREGQRDPQLADLAERLLRKPFNSYGAPSKRAIVAVLYTLALQEGSTRPQQYIVKRTGAAPASIKTYIGQARKEGLLTPVRPGVIGGSVTPTALRLLDAL